MVGLSITIRMRNCSACPAVWVLRLPLPLNSTAEPFPRLQWPTVPIHLPCCSSLWKCASIRCPSPTCPSSNAVWLSSLSLLCYYSQSTFRSHFLPRNVYFWTSLQVLKMRDTGQVSYRVHSLAPLHLHEKQVWGSYEPKLGTIFLLYDIFMIALWSAISLWFYFLFWCHFLAPTVVSPSIWLIG